MTLDEFTGVTFNYLDASRIRISMSSQVSVINRPEILLYMAQSTFFMNQETMDKTIESRKVDKLAEIRNLHVSVLYI